MTLPAGALRHRIEIHELVSEQDEDTGNFEETWPLFVNAWAEVRPATVREIQAAGGEVTKTSTTFRIRYIAGIKRSMRIRHGERLFNIEGVMEDPDSGREYLILPCSEVSGE